MASFLFGEDVLVSELDVGAGANLDEFEVFSRQIKLRHALACTSRLVSIIDSIDAGMSTTTHLIEAECRGAIRGQLRIGPYIARRLSAIGLARTL